MSNADTYLFDVGVIALAHGGTPVSDTALEYVRAAIRGEIDAIVPYPALFGAHTVLTNYYGYSNDDASTVLRNLLDATRIRWHAAMSEPLVRTGLDLAGDANIDGWDGYYAAVARDQNADTILTLDDDFTAVDGVETEAILSPEQFSRLQTFIEG